ncbi:unnamed protein product [Allacma fusca]|uniref:Uncharacterized protein n=1 Tax=Allacma fusca TaxID=39272 RepID=A0A8J2JXZ4_9HEXA|nr:unnamed protein product [Allacma fusca]
MEDGDLQCHEIITLQVGNYANYVGAHFFNLQNPERNGDSEINPHVLWRQVSARQNHPRWSPRLITFDLKNNYFRTTQFESTSDPSNSLEEVSKGVLWDGSIQTFDQRGSFEASPQENNKESGNEKDKDRREQGGTLGAAKSSEINRVRGQVKNWVDFTQWRLHSPETSKFSVGNFSHNPTLGTLSNYGQGLQIFKSMEETVTDTIRRYAEDADYFQGFHILADQQDGFGGIASGILEHISDEYDKKTSFTFGLSSPTVAGGKEQFPDLMLRLLNSSLSWNSFSLHSSVFSSIGLSKNLFQSNPEPVVLPHVTYDPSSSLESSSVLAAALDTLTSPYRMKEPKISLPEIVSLLNAYGHKMAVIGMAFPFSLFNETTLFDTLRVDGLNGLRSLTPGVQLNLEKNIGNFFVPRGFRPQQVIQRRQDGRAEGLQEQQGRGITNAESCLEVYSQETFPKSVNVVRSVQTPFKLSHPFPVLFDHKVLESLKISGSRAPSIVGESWEVPTIGSAHNSPAAGETLQRLIDVLDGRGKNFLRGGSILSENLDMEFDDYQESLNNLKVLRDAYLPDSTL